MKFRSILVLLLLCIAVSVNAQRKHGPGFDIEKIKREKAQFLKTEMGLTEDEAKVFLPLESEFTQKKYEVNRNARRETRELKKKENKTDADYKRITQLNLESEQRESELQIEYYRKFANVLPASKVEKYRTADLKFKERMLQEHRKHHPKK